MGCEEKAAQNPYRNPRHAGTHYTLPTGSLAARKLVFGKEKRDAHSALQELFCHVFQSLLLQPTQTSSGLPSRTLTPTTEDLTWGYLVPFSLFLQRKALDHSILVKGELFFFMTTKQDLKSLARTKQIREGFLKKKNTYKEGILTWTTELWTILLQRKINI